MTTLPQGWASSKLDEVAEFEMGQAPPASTCNMNGEGTIFVKAGEFGPEYPVVREWTKKPLKFARQGDVLICVVGATAGKLNLGINCAIGRSVAAIRPFISEMQRCIYSQLRQQVMSLRGDSTGTAQGVISKQILADIKIVIPPLVEQKRISDKLDIVLGRVDAVNARLARVAPLLKRFRKSVLSAAHTGQLLPGSWQDAPMRKLGDLLSDGPKNGLYKHRSAYGQGTPILRIDAFYDGRVIGWSSLKQLILDDAERAAYRLSNGDIVINRVNSMEYLGKCALIEGLEDDCVFESNMMRMRMREYEADSRFIRNWLCSENAKEQIRSKAKQAVNQASINQTDVLNLELRLPSLESQVEIVRRVEILFAFADRLEARLQAARTAAERLTPALLAKAFRGELVPQDPDDEPAAELLQRLQASQTAAAPKRGKGKGKAAA